ncbi:uncharacterized protein LOC117532559 [Gymnodraco acuticeps]|uniref:Uncharacterized protein LOC117532559 n=1 Tax=Gymnodraco acuticeps TaxID=8218 RepID=A0A6P8SNK3_GYMAC|nr:uncharacterized protein LOC117532559 [Gymnodraco acuticeps]XP_034051781.1 uncharacterized protein LOC117532559 [Gymnodraco acuticeps]
MSRAMLTEVALRHISSDSQKTQFRTFSWDLRCHVTERKRQVLERIIDVLKLIGQSGLSYSGTQAEALYTQDDDTIDHGNFLEMIVLLGKYDVCLKEHLTLCTEKSKQIHQSGLRQGRGSLVTLLSKTTINYIITTIQRLMKATIATEVRESGMYSVQIDTTQDITAQDQCSVVIRYVTDIVHERLVAVIKCEAFTGQYFAQLVVHEVLETMKLDVRQCIGNSTDGASNMQGQYKGFSALLAKMSPTHVHVWCYAHVLNLVLADTTQCVLASGSLFSLLNNIAVFIRESYQRMNIWEKESKDPRHRRLAPIGEIRWWSKDVAVTKVFGSFGKPDNALYVDVLHTLSAIQHGQTINATARVNARGYITLLLRYETILTAQIFLRIFQVTSPVSKYLQKSGMDILTAHRMIVAAETQLKDMTRDFEKVKTAAATFVQWANNQTEEQSEETELEVEAALPQKRGRKKKTMPGEMSKDEAVTDAETSYKIDVHNQIMDTVTGSMHQRFLKNGTLYADLALLAPKRFNQVTSYAGGFPEAALQELSKCLLPFDDRATVAKLQSELISLAGQWNRLKTSVFEEYTTKTTEAGPEDAEDEAEMVYKKCSSCKDCPLCCYRILKQYNLLTDAYHIIGLAYRFLLTLSVTQVACERSFSTLKLIKNRLRSSLSQQNLESFMLMATQPDVLKMLDSDQIIDGVAEKSELLQKLLIQ